ncbi:MAG: hydrogenase maturation protease [Planctomycetes bacterium]|nr:hydrogenase maturation protease [Planctomycetota bacterium]
MPETWPPIPSPRVVVLGVGNELMGDDGVGVVVARQLRAAGPGNDVEVIEAGTSVMDALDLVPSRAHVLVVDAATGGGEAGSVYRFRLDELALARGVSLHETSLPEAFTLAQLAGAKFGKVIVIGVEPARVEPGTELSPVLQEKMPAILGVVRAEVAKLMHSS